MKRLLLLSIALILCVIALASERSKIIVSINGARYYVHTIEKGETLYKITKLYDITESEVIDNNPALKQGFTLGTKIKIPYKSAPQPKQSARKLKRSFDFHSVERGETLYAISRKYEIPIQTIIEDNPTLDPSALALGQKILIRKAEQGTEGEAESSESWEQYRNALNSVAPQGRKYHIVAKGETLYSLSRAAGITQAELSEMNGGLTSDDLKVGAIIELPAPKSEVTAESEVKVEIRQREVAPPVRLKALSKGEVLDVALLLPLSSAGRTNSSFMEFYQGFLLGLDSVKSRYGISLNLDLYNTNRDTARVANIVQQRAFASADIVVGPIYEEQLEGVIDFAESEAIPVVSPLANIVDIDSDVIFQLAPSPKSKFDKMIELRDTAYRVTLIYTDNIDDEFEREILSQLFRAGKGYRKHHYEYVHPSQLSDKADAENPSDLQPLLSNRDDNLFVILASSEVDVERILAALSSANRSLVARSIVTPRYRVVGNARWNRYRNLDREMFFANRVSFISSYHAKRDSDRVIAFDADYLREFGALPTLFSYRGYDAAMIFIPAMYSDIDYDLENRRYTPLHTTYIFDKVGGGSNHVNTNWMRVDYNSDYTIGVK